LNIGHLAFISNWTAEGLPRLCNRDIPGSTLGINANSATTSRRAIPTVLQALFSDTLARAGDLAGARILSETAAAKSERTCSFMREMGAS